MMDDKESKSRLETLNYMDQFYRFRFHEFLTRNFKGLSKEDYDRICSDLGLEVYFGFKSKAISHLKVLTKFDGLGFTQQTRKFVNLLYAEKQIRKLESSLENIGESTIPF